jgi:cytochrome P450
VRLLSTAASEAAEGPVTEASCKYNPFSPSYVLDPYPTLAELRTKEPVFFSPEINSWVVTRFDTIKKVLRDADRFSARIASDPLTPLCPAARSVIQESDFDVPPMLVNNDPPSHARYRSFFSEPLQRARFDSLEPFIRQTVDGFLDRLATADRPADLVAALTWDVPALVLFKLLGIPQEDVGKVKEWASSRVVLTWGRPSEAEQFELSKGALEYFHYAVELVQRKAAAPGDDYLSDLVRQRDGDDGKMTLHEIAGIAFNLLFAGHETTSSGAINTFAALLRDRPLWERVRLGEQPMGPVVEEGLRFDPPVQGWRRQAKVDVELDGITLPAGSRLLLMFAAANRDPAQFDRPDDFIPGRRNVMQHTTFGTGSHFCLGAPLARLEIQVMLEQVAKRFPTLAIVPDQTLEYVPNTSFRALKKLLVQW